MLVLKFDNIKLQKNLDKLKIKKKFKIIISIWKYEC